MNGKEKRNLKSRAKTRSIDLKIGKKGLTDTFLEEANKVLVKDSMIKFSHSLIKSDRDELIAKIELRLSVILIENVGKTLTFHKTTP
jgi:RNA-binding protein YhbY